MVLYYGRARTRIGSVNTNQTGLKMAGCPSKVGKRGTISRHISKRVNCAMGACGIPKLHQVDWKPSFRNFSPYCKLRATKCLQAAGGIRKIYVPYYKTIAPGKTGCCVPSKPFPSHCGSAKYGFPGSLPFCMTKC